MPENIFTYLYFVCVIVETVIRSISVKRVRQDRSAKVIRQRSNTLDKFLVFLPFIGMFILPLIYSLTPWLYFADYHLPDWAGWLGVAIFAGSIWLLWRSHADLGRAWSSTLMITEEQPLVTQGVYRHIRHPMYAAHWLWSIAQAMLLQNWIAGFATLVLFLPLYLVRVPRERILHLGGHPMGPQLYFGMYFDMAPITLVITKAQRVLVFRPTAFSEGLKETYRWYLRHHHKNHIDYAFEDRLMAAASLSMAV